MEFPRARRSTLHDFQRCPADAPDTYRKSRRAWKPARSLVAPLSPAAIKYPTFRGSSPCSAIVSMRISLDPSKYEFFSLFRAEAQINAFLPVVNSRPLDCDRVPKERNSDGIRPAAAGYYEILHVSKNSTVCRSARIHAFRSFLSTVCKIPPLR